MNHSCGTVALDSLLILRLNHKKKRRPRAMVPQLHKTQLYVNRVEPTLQYTKLFKQTKNMIQVDTIMKNIWPIFVWQCRPSLNWHKAKKKLWSISTTILLYTYKKTILVDKEYNKFNRFWDFAHLLAVYFIILAKA